MALGLLAATVSSVKMTSVNNASKSGTVQPLDEETSTLAELKADKCDCQCNSDDPDDLVSISDDEDYGDEYEDDSEDDYDEEVDEYDDDDSEDVY